MLLGTRKTAGRDRGPWRSIDHFVTWPTGRLVVQRRARDARRSWPHFSRLGVAVGVTVGAARKGTRSEGRVYHKTRWGVYHAHLPFSPVSVWVFRPKPADPSRASGAGKDGSDPPIFAAGAALRWGRCTTSCTTPCYTHPPAKLGSLPSEIILAGRLRRPPTGASGRADERRDDAARRRVFADRRRYVLVVRVALARHVPRR